MTGGPTSSQAPIPRALRSANQSAGRIDGNVASGQSAATGECREQRLRLRGQSAVGRVRVEPTTPLGLATASPVAQADESWSP
jgi:hypothetical protein